MPTKQNLVRVAIAVPIDDAFDYIWTGDGPIPAPGTRVRVPFGKRDTTGLVIEHPKTSKVDRALLKEATIALDDAPIVSSELIESLSWAAQYYHHPIGEVMTLALPAPLRKGHPVAPAPEYAWRLTAGGQALDPNTLASRAHRQAAALRTLEASASVTASELKATGCSSDTLKRLARKGWVEKFEIDSDADRPADSSTPPVEQPPTLTPDQQAAVDAVLASAKGFETFLLHGVTGSGKTEVFLRLIARELEHGRQTLLLVPEISLTPQLIARLEARFGSELAVLHSGLSDRDRLSAWRQASRGAARLIVGTRSAAFSPLPAAGLIIVDEEHDPSFKQQHGFRYSARDLAIVRARALGIPILLASATPSLESFRNTRDGRYQRLTLPARIGSAGNPDIRTIDMNRHAARQGLSTPLLALMDQHLDRGNQVLLFINRRGFAPVLFCADCEKSVECDRCDARMTIHARVGRLRCHHCASEKTLHWACPDCGAERIAVGAGTQRITTELQSLYPDRKIARLDRDAVASRESLGSVLAGVQSGETQIIVGTQMLTKGHDFPKVTLVGVLNADQGLFSTDFRSDERLAQTIIQVAGRAGRRDQPGEVVIQTHYPRHPLLEYLLDADYAAFADYALAERAETNWPPYSHLALWRAEATKRPLVFEFLNRLRGHAQSLRSKVKVLGPTPDWMERRSGRYRAQLLFQSTDRALLHALISANLAEIRGWPESRRVRWSIDVDPLEL